MIGVTIGDANGAGREIFLKSYREKRLHDDFFAIGDYRFLKNYIQALVILPVNKEDVRITHPDFSGQI